MISPTIQTDLLTVYQGDALSVLRQLESESVDVVVTSGPYWGLRDYKSAPIVFGGDPSCTHQWVDHLQPAANGIIHEGGMSDGDPIQENSGTRQAKRSAFCSACGAWRGQLGLEPTLALFIEHMVEIFEEVRRVLKKTGSCWINAGDSMAGSWGAQSRPGTTDRNDIHSTLKGSSTISARQIAEHPRQSHTGSKKRTGLRQKNICGQPFRLAFALQDAGWDLRADLIWSKTQPTPESVLDRPTRSHEYIFMLTKNAKPILWRNILTGEWSPIKKQGWVYAPVSMALDTAEDSSLFPEQLEVLDFDEAQPQPVDDGREWRKVRLWRGFDYYYEADAIAEPCVSGPSDIRKMVESKDRIGGKAKGLSDEFNKCSSATSIGRKRAVGGKKLPGNYKGSVPGRKDGPGQDRRGDGARGRKYDGQDMRASRDMGRDANWRQETPDALFKNARSVWTIATSSFKGAHFAVMPEEIPRRAISAGCPVGGVVLDLFAGSGTVGQVALELGRKAVLIEINPDYIDMIRSRCGGVTIPMFVGEKL